MESNRPRTYAELVSDQGRHRALKGFRRAHRGVWVPESLNDSHLSRLEALTTACPGVVATGWMSAAIYGHPWLPEPEPVEATSRRRFRRPGATIHRYDVPARDTWEALGPGGGRVRLASPAWTLFDLARRLPPVEAVVALDAGLDERYDVDPVGEFRRLYAAHSRLRHKNKAMAALALMDRRSESPWETRTRLVLIEMGFDVFVPQVPVPGLPYRLDLACERYRVGVEYDGAYHRDGAQQARDIERANRIRAEGWEVIPVTARTLRRSPGELAIHVEKALLARGWPGPKRWTL